MKEEIATQDDSGHDVRDSNIGSEEQDIKNTLIRNAVMPLKNQMLLLRG
ncbi:MAG UNVERIFIED_CONTAM: hypothetical protein LVR29_26370 [Microcystis novacekii LVE1205-3]|jgi:hypothetical protein